MLEPQCRSQGSSHECSVRNVVQTHDTCCINVMYIVMVVDLLKFCTLSNRFRICGIVDESCPM